MSRLYCYCIRHQFALAIPVSNIMKLHHTTFVIVATIQILNFYVQAWQLRRAIGFVPKRYVTYLNASLPLNPKQLYQLTMPHILSIQ